MDDPSVEANETTHRPEPATRRTALGPKASFFVLGLLAGLAVGWLAWRGSGPDANAASRPLPGAEAGTVIHGVDVTGDPTEGPADAPVTIVEFSDFECPYCTRFAQVTAPVLRRQYGDNLRWIFVNNPLQSIHPNAYDLALAGECAHEQERFWPFYEAMFSGQYGADRASVIDAARSIGVDIAKFTTCYENADHAAEVAADLKEAQKFYIFGTPTFFVNGQRLEGALPAEAFAQVIDEALAGSGS